MGPGCSRMPLAILLPSSLAGTVQPHFLSPNLTQTRNIPTSAHCPCTKSYKILIKLDNLWISPFLRQCGAVSTDCPKGGFVFFKSILPLSTSLGAVAAGGWAQLSQHLSRPPTGACLPLWSLLRVTLPAILGHRCTRSAPQRSAHECAVLCRGSRVPMSKLFSAG